MSTYQDLKTKALSLRQKYSQFEQQTYGKEWTREQLVQGLVGDVGDLVKLTQARSGIRQIPDAEQKFQHELADCLWSLIVIADAYDLDLEKAFYQTMDELEQKLDRTLEQ